MVAGFLEVPTIDIRPNFQGILPPISMAQNMLHCLHFRVLRVALISQFHQNGPNVLNLPHFSEHLLNIPNISHNLMSYIIYTPSPPLVKPCPSPKILVPFVAPLEAWSSRESWPSYRDPPPRSWAWSTRPGATTRPLGASMAIHRILHGISCDFMRFHEMFIRCLFDV